MIKYLVLSKTEPKPPTDIQYTVTPPQKKPRAEAVFYVIFVFKLH